MNDGPLEPRYRITHKDGQPIDPTHRLFVLSVDTDPYALRAASYYAQICAETHPELAADMRATYGLQPIPTEEPAITFKATPAVPFEIMREATYQFVRGLSEVLWSADKRSVTVLMHDDHTWSLTWSDIKPEGDDVGNG